MKSLKMDYKRYRGNCIWKNDIPSENSFSFFSPLMPFSQGMREIRHTQILAFFLNANKTQNGLQKHGWKKFYKLLKKKKIIPTIASKEIPIVYSEFVAKGSRFDIVLEFDKSLVVIEAKIGAPRNDGQLTRYKKLLDKNYQKKRIDFVYLDIGYMKNKKELPNGWTSLTWAEVLGSMTSAYEESCKRNKKNINEPSHVFIKGWIISSMNDLYGGWCVALRDYYEVSKI